MSPDPTRTEEFVAEGDLLTDVGGTLPQKVLSTPGMIHMMEWACARLIGESVPERTPPSCPPPCMKGSSATPSLTQSAPTPLGP